MSESVACAGCLRRSWLLAALSPYMERHVAGDADEALRLVGLGDEELANIVAPRAAEQVLARAAACGEDWFAERLAEAACWAVCRHSDLFPVGLLQAVCSPPALFGRGSLILFCRSPETMVSIVGSGLETSYGWRAARTLARECATAGLTVVGDMSRMVGTFAQEGALDVGPTVAVLAGGPDIAFDAGLRHLYERIAAGGAVVSELPPGVPSTRWAVAARERILASISQMTVVVEPITPPTHASAVGLAGWLDRGVGAVAAPLCREPAGGTVAELTGGRAVVVEDGGDVLTLLLDL
jgi:DNA processing protein